VNSIINVSSHYFLSEFCQLHCPVLPGCSSSSLSSLLLPYYQVTFNIAVDTIFEAEGLQLQDKDIQAEMDAQKKQYEVS
jgi:hypothetical protein